ncbi:hypothetical protein ACVY4S_002932, partial [Escherichia coli]
PLRSLPWLFTTAAGVVWDRLQAADPGGPATISSQAYAYYMQNVPFCIFVPTAHRDLFLGVSVHKKAHQYMPGPK